MLEMGALIAGPFAGRLLADMGADVIKIEAPDRPDPMRDWGKTVDGRGLWWPVMARNKRCITLDLRQSEGQEIALQLVGALRCRARELPAGNARALGSWL